MGTLIYGYTEIAIDDRSLQHLQIVITAKLRRHESFVLSWINAVENGSGRTSIWIDVGIPIIYQFDGNRTPNIDRDWLDELMKSANSGQGLIFSPRLPAGAEQPAQLRVEKTRRAST